MECNSNVQCSPWSCSWWEGVQKSPLIPQALVGQHNMKGESGLKIELKVLIFSSKFMKILSHHSICLWLHFSWGSDTVIYIWINVFCSQSSLSAFRSKFGNLSETKSVSGCHMCIDFFYNLLEVTFNCSKGYFEFDKAEEIGGVGVFIKKLFVKMFNIALLKLLCCFVVFSVLNYILYCSNISSNYHRIA